MKQIIIDEKTKNELMEKFKNYLNSTKFTESNVNFNAEMPKPTAERPTVFINPTAYLKMMLYVRDTSTEIAWHGVVEKNKEKNMYYIKDVFLYPQKLAAATVQTDQEKYNKWLEELDDDTYNALRFQGHSHVNFGVTPSGTDMNYYEDILNVLPKNDYYIFMILNKAGDMTLLIYDLEKNTIFETADIDVKIITPKTQNLVKEIKEQKEEFCETPTYNYSYGSSNLTYKDFMNYTGYGSKYEPKTKTDLLFDELDKKYEVKTSKYANPTLKLTKKGGKK